MPGRLSFYKKTEKDKMRYVRDEIKMSDKKVLNSKRGKQGLMQNIMPPKLY